MAKLIWTEKAIGSLEDIYDYIAADSPFYARFQIERILEAVERLNQFPESGRKLSELPHLPHREIIVDAYRIIYRSDTKQIE
jgi:toxin ParE1/3/4